MNFKIKPHMVTPDREVVELWHNGAMLGVITFSTERPQITIFSRHMIDTAPGNVSDMSVLQILITKRIQG